MNILDDLYFGNINQNCKMAPPGSQLRKIQALVMQNEEKRKRQIRGRVESTPQL